MGTVHKESLTGRFGLRLVIVALSLLMIATGASADDRYRTVDGTNRLGKHRLALVKLRPFPEKQIEVSLFGKLAKTKIDVIELRKDESWDFFFEPIHWFRRVPRAACPPVPSGGMR